MMRKILFTFSLILLLTSCVDNHGHVVKGGDFTVHFELAEDEQMAVQLAEFWKENDLIREGKQDIKLRRNGEKYEVLIIARQKEHQKELGFKERKLLFELQSKLQDSVFNRQKVELVISDDHFKPILNINE